MHASVVPVARITIAHMKSATPPLIVAKIARRSDRSLMSQRQMYTMLAVKPTRPAVTSSGRN